MPRLKLTTPRRKKEKKQNEENILPSPFEIHEDDVYSDPQVVDDMFQTMLGPNNLDMPEKDIENLLNIKQSRKIQLIDHYQAIGPTLQSPRASGARNSPAGYLQELRVLLLLRVAETQAREEESASKKSRGRSNTWTSMRKLLGRKVPKEESSSTFKLASFLSALRVAISSQPVRWFKDFINQGAIDDLTRLLSSSCQRLASDTTPVDEHEQENVVQFEATTCLKKCINNSAGIDYMVARQELRGDIMHLLMVCLDAKIELTKTDALELLSVLTSMFHFEVLAALDDYKDSDKESPFSRLVALLKNEKSSIVLRTNILCVFSSLIHCSASDKSGKLTLAHLQGIRKELNDLGVKEVIVDIHNQYDLPTDNEITIDDKRLSDLRTQLISFHQEIEEPPPYEPQPETEELEVDAGDDDDDKDFLFSEESDVRDSIAEVDSEEVMHELQTLRQRDKKQCRKIASLKKKLGAACEENQILREGKVALESEFTKIVEEVRGLRAIYDVVDGALEEKEKEALEDNASIQPKSSDKPLPQRLDVVKVSEVLDGVLRSPCSPFAHRMKRIPKRQMFEAELADHESPPLDELEESFEPWQHYNISNIDVRGLPRMESELLQNEVGTWRNLYEELSQEHRKLEAEHADANIQLAELKVNLLDDMQALRQEKEELSMKIHAQEDEIQRLIVAKTNAENARDTTVCGRIQELEEHLKELMLESSDLQEKLSTAEASLEQLEEAYQQTSRNLLETELNLETKTASYEKTLQQKEQKMAGLLSRLEDSKAARESLESAKAQLERDIAERDQQLEAIHQQLSEDTESPEDFDLNALKVEIMNLKASKVSLEESAAQLSKEKIELAGELRELQEETTLTIEDLQRVLEETYEELQERTIDRDASRKRHQEDVQSIEERLRSLAEDHDAEIVALKQELIDVEEKAAERERELESSHESAVEDLRAKFADVIAEEKAAIDITKKALEEEFQSKTTEAIDQIKIDEQTAAKRELERQLRELKASVAEEKEQVRLELQAAKETEAAAMAAFEAKRSALLKEIEEFKAEKKAFDDIQDAIRKEKEEAERKEKEKAEAEAKAAAEAEAAAKAAAAAAPPPPPMPMVGNGAAGFVPPPPGAPGMPPPPPMMGGKAVQQVLPEGCDKVPSVKLKSLQWKKIAPYKAAGTVFAVTKTPDNVNLPVDDLEKLFCAAPAKKSSDKDTTEEKESTSKKPVSLLDPRRAQNIAILLSSLKATYRQVRDAIISMDDEFLNPTTLRQLIKLAPTAEEMDMVKSFQEQNPEAILGSAESFFLAIDVIPALQERLVAMLFKHDLTTKMPELTGELELLRSTTLQVQKAKHFPALLKVLLHFGNFMNGGTFRGRASAFQLSSILTLKDTRACDGKGTLLHFIVDYIYNNHEELIKFADELSLTEKASRLSFPTISEEVHKLRQAYNSNIDAVANVDVCDGSDGAPTDNFSDVMTSFLEGAAPSLKVLEDLLQSTAKEFVELATFYGEADPSRVQPNEFFHTLHSFRTQFLLARKEKELEEERKVKEANRQKEREKRRQSILDAAKLRNSPRTSLRPDGSVEEESGEEGVVDNIFAQIRGGDFGRARRRSSIVRNRTTRPSLSYTGQMGEVSASSLRRQSVARSLVCSPPGSPAGKVLSPSNGRSPAPAEDKEVFAIFNNIKKRRASRLSQISSRNPIA